MKRKDYFYGKYYKFISPSGYVFAFIDAHSNEGHLLQIITPDKSYYDIAPSNITICDRTFIFDVHIKGLDLTGSIEMDKYRPLKRKVMGPFRFIPFMECKHDIYSMHHKLDGSISINNKEISFKDGYGYIEGDSGTSFPTRYIWYNAVNENVSLTVAIATIPFGLFSFTGLLGFILIDNKEYYLSTYNLAKIIKKKDYEIKIKKRKYCLKIKIYHEEGHELKAPIRANMHRIIKENIKVPSKVLFIKKRNVLLSLDNLDSSIEWQD